MTHAVLITMWWFLAMPVQYSPFPSFPQQSCSTGAQDTRSYGGMMSFIESDHVAPPPPSPLAVGPFPTEQMCMAAENLAEPTNKDFWTDKQKADYDAGVAESKASCDTYKRWVAALAKANPKVGMYRLGNTEFWIGKPNSTMPMTRYYSISFDDYGVGTAEGTLLYGKSVPEIKPPPSISYGSWSVKHPCQAVKGWYEAKP